MVTRATISVWETLAEMANLLTWLNAMPPLRNCLATRRYFADDPESMHRLLKDAQQTLLWLRRLRETGSATIH
jgi:hypothetical protein